MTDRVNDPFPSRRMPKRSKGDPFPRNDPPAQVVEYYEQCSREIFPVTVLVAGHHAVAPVPVGTAMIIEAPPSFAVVTAAHVLDETAQMGGTYLLIAENWVKIDGAQTETIRCPQEEADSLRSRDYCDLAIVFPDASAWAYQPSSILPLERLSVRIGVEGNPHLMFGYPVSKQPTRPFDDQRTFRPQPYSHYACSFADHTDSGLDPNDNLLMHYEAGAEMPNGNRAVSPVGFSGGGIWYLDPSMSLDSPALLVAIGITWRAYEDRIVGTRVRRVLEAIAVRCPDARERIRVIMGA